MSNKILEVNDLIIKYVTDDFTVNAVNGITFAIDTGRTLGLVGETGAGKTTTALSIMGLLPERVGKIDNGSIRFEGSELLGKSDKEMDEYRGKSISMIYQDPMTSLNPTMTIGKQIDEVLLTHHICEKKDVVEKTAEILSLVGIMPNRAGEYPNQFSGGMKQRVVIAMALACKPKLLIADEPTTALDVTIQAQVLLLVKDLKDKLGTSMLLITHDLGIVGEICDDVAIMYAGELIEMGDVESVFNNPVHPYTGGLISSIPDIDSDVDRLTPIPGLMPDPTNLPTGCPFHPRCGFKEDICEKEVPPATKNGNHEVRCHICKI